ncbi:hypothetical protein AKJ09_03175 [Labilithrix luteola]|uniref:BNR repeat domain protein n=1 Tax=Labilithrix luteola TaxID=1391654 RepID=A0A0K1PT10_9BACT|nr:RCC1 domain-containing protein [Labilithrix luteola]AKU96511.1 hypothetical protein AKJ09_03175 [Labilithrix luteola]
MKRRMRFLFMLAPVAATTILVACSNNDPTPAFDDAPDGASEAAANLPETAAPDAQNGDGGALDARAPFDAEGELVTCTTKPCVTQLVTGDTHYCALMDDKTVRCWGVTSGAIGIMDGGDPSTSYQTVPRDVGLTDVEQLSAANGTTCALHTNGTVTCWGSNNGGRLGLEPPRTDYVPHGPALVTRDGGPIDGFTRIDVGPVGLVFATTSAGELWSWGTNIGDALGRPDETNRILGPGPANAITRVKALRAGGFASENTGGFGFAVADDRKLFVWGAYRWLVTYPGTAPLAVTGLENVTSVAASTERLCAVADGRLYCWGPNGALSCTGTKDGSATPVEIRTRGEAPAREVSISYGATCVRLTDGTVECCGTDSFGQLATGDADGGTGAPLLTKAKALTDHVVSIQVGLFSSCALVQGGKVQCWGSNQYGQLGQGTRDDDRHGTPLTVKFD